MKFLFYLAKHFFFKGSDGQQKSKASLFAFFGIVLVTTFVLVALGILSGYQRAYRDSIMGFNAHVVVSGRHSFFVDEQKKITTAFEKLQTQFVFFYTPYLYYESLIPTTQGMRPFILKGIDLAKHEQMYPFEIEELRLKSFSKTLLPIILGKGILDLQPQARATGSLKMLSLRDKKGRQATTYEKLFFNQTFSTGLYHYDGQFALADLQSLQRKYFQDEPVQGYEIKLKNPDALTNFMDSLRQELPEGISLTTWMDLNRDVLESLSLEKTTVFAVIFLIVTIASLNIFGFNFLFFIGKQREFQILSLIGLTQQRLGRLLQILSLALCIGATFIGCILGLVILAALFYGPGLPLDPQIYYVDRVPVAWRLEWFLGFLFLSWGLCYLASVFAGKVIIKRYLGSQMTH